MGGGGRVNQVVYVAAPAQHVDARTVRAAAARTTGKWESVQRVTKERHQQACSALRMHYESKAKALGMTLAGYCQRFGVKL